MSGLFINFFQYELSNEYFEIYSLAYDDYSSKEAYLGLKASNPDYAFYRRGDSIFLWMKRPTVIPPTPLGKKVRINRREQPHIVSKIMEVAFEEQIRTLNTHKLYKNKHSHSWELTSSKDAFEGHIPGLIANRQVIVTPYFFTPGEKIFHGFTFSASLKYKFVWKVGDFQAKGIDLGKLKIAEDDETVIPDVTSRYYFLEATGTQSLFEAKVAELEKSEKTFGLITSFSGWLQKNKDKIFLPTGVKVVNFTWKYLPFDRVRSEQFSTPQRFFFGGATNTNGLRFYNEMVKTYKPSSYGSFEDEKINIGVLFPAEYEGVTEGFVNKIDEVLKAELHLNNLSFHLIKINDTSLVSYEKGIYQDAEKILKTLNLFLIIVNEEHEKLPPALSPYYFCKAKLIGDGIPTQDIQAETIKKRLHPLVWSNIALNVYAKLGGTAWTIEKEEKRKDELVIGIGSTIRSDGQTVLGIAQVFHSDGRYIVGDCAPLSTFENYSENLEEYLYNQLYQVITNNLNTKETFRLIFHLYKSAGADNEIRAIENVTRRLSAFKFDFALLHLGYGHNFRLYNDDGKAQIKRGTYIKLDAHTALLHFVGESSLPLKIELDKRSKGFTDLFYLAKQAYWFSSLSHRSYNPSKRTVTLMYPSLMALMTEKLCKVPHWNYDRLKYVSDKLWFI